MTETREHNGRVRAPTCWPDARPAQPTGPTVCLWPKRAARWHTKAALPAPPSARASSMQIEAPPTEPKSANFSRAQTGAARQVK